MTVPQDRDELLAEIATVLGRKAGFTGQLVSSAYADYANAVLDALEKAGTVIVPMTPTQEMLWNTRQHAGGCVVIHEMAADDYVFAVAASPYRRKTDD
jgi:hypothetical protein